MNQETSGSTQVPWYCYTGFNLLVLWNFATFSFDISSFSVSGSSLGITSSIWITFAGSQAVFMGLLSLVPLRLSARSLSIVTWCAACLTALGTIGMTMPGSVLPFAFAIIAGACFSWLWIPWCVFFSMLTTARSEQIIKRSMFVSVALLAVFLVLPAGPRFLAAQLLPIASAWASQKTTAYTGMQHLAETRDEQAPRPTSKVIVGLTVPSMLAFFLLAFATESMDAAPDVMMPLSMFLGFAAAALITAAFFWFTPSVSLAFVFRWQMPIVAVALVAYAFRLSYPVVYALLAATLIMISEFIWIYLCAVMRANRTTYLRVFLGGYFFFDLGEFIGSLASSYFVGAWQTGIVSFQDIGYVLLLFIVLCSVFMTYVPVAPRASDFGLDDDEPGEQGFASRELPARGDGNVGAPSVRVSSTRGASSVAAMMRTHVEGDGAASNTVVDADTALRSDGVSAIGGEPSDEDHARGTASSMQEFATFFRLTPREVEIIGYLAHGRSAPFIRDALFISQNTVNTHIKHIYAKTDVNSRQELLDLLEGYVYENQK